MVNTKNAEKSFNIPNELANSEWKDLLEDSAVNLSDVIILQPYEYLILGK
jgi:hypothetical protein